MRKLILSLLVAFSCFIAKAQISVALVAGPQINSISPAFSLNPDTSSTYSPSKHTGLNFGFIGNAALNKKQTLFFRTGVLYSARGSQLLQQYDTSNIDFIDGKHFLQTTTNLKINYIDIPVNLLYKFPLKGKTKFLLGGGVQASLFYNGSTDFNSIKAYKDDPDSSAKLEYKEVINKDLPVGNAVNKYRTVYFSANAITGFEFGKAFITVSYSNGLTDFFRSDAQSFRHNTLSFHFGIFLGTTHVNKTEPVQTVVVKDRDNDGIIDDLDQCPDLPGTATTYGCPDKDGDGIADKDDRCPDVPGLKKYNGCPIPDSDNDGVNDEEDQCPTVAGDKDNHGCPKVTKEQQQQIDYAARRIQFEFKSAVLSTSSYEMIDKVVELLKSNPTFKIKVEGHSSGPEGESNKLLSQKRAESVRDYLIDKGITADRILAQGFGSSRHISKDGDKKESPEDRRVELIIF